MNEDIFSELPSVFKPNFLKALGYINQVIKKEENVTFCLKEGVVTLQFILMSNSLLEVNKANIFLKKEISQEFKITCSRKASYFYLIAQQSDVIELPIGDRDKYKIRDFKAIFRNTNGDFKLELWKTIVINCCLKTNTTNSIIIFEQL